MIVATGGSVIEAAKALKAAGAKKIFACIVHGILSLDAPDRVKSSCIDFLAISDSIPIVKDKLNKKIRVISTAKLFAEAIKRIHKEESISVLFNSIRS